MTVVRGGVVVGVAMMTAMMTKVGRGLRVDAS